MFRYLLICFSLLFIGCDSYSPPQKTSQPDPMRPGKAATHIVELYKVQIGAKDFNLSSFGNPLDIEVIFKENGNVISPQGIYLLDGKRGERILNKPMVWVVNFDPNKNYQIVLKEVSIVASAQSWSIPGTPKIGYWPIGVNNGHISFGKDSYLQFRDKIAE